ncbi:MULTISPECIES: site-specific DNA-methyltransferase [Bradyrhizobium]|uniref:site-specific DNA-methyltransferase n=1 Tax=Bradyrhizobium TaxID=374 RepID=UPI000D73A2B5|nr:site-specific DNA-methyltransferase [Bradyrhizobium diazoefficiens]AWO87812.1 site-specific DNA-methyltransferase [Bradyrhizobium diazoefficiens]
MAPKKKPEAVTKPKAGEAVASLKYSAKRKNIPPAGLEAQGVLTKEPRIRYEYNPHLPTVLRSAVNAAEVDNLPELLATARRRALSAEEANLLANALRRHEPWLEWSGKREKPWFEVEPVPLHMHERVSTQAVLRVLAREDIKRDLFADPQQEYARAVQFYKHDVDWANRMVLGDSLQVMASLARREDLAGRVQMIYLDPPYGIKFSSNFQPKLGQHDVKDREQDLTREPEMVKAYRDTWTLGVHSYLSYLRDRLAMARELLADTGSIFVQISDENLHRVRCLLDEVFESENFVSQIVFRTTSSLGGDFIPASANYLLWYARDKEKAKFRPLFKPRGFEDDVGGRFSRALLSNGAKHTLTTEERGDISLLENGARIYRHDNLTSQSGGEHSAFKIDFEGNQFAPGNGFWKTNPAGIERLKKSERIAAPTTKSLTYVRFLDDFPLTGFSEVWSDTQTGAFTDSKIYVVQTNTKVVERCLLMTTDPGDLVLDPTCGSGTTAYVSEQWGRRWITCDSSRVALALAKHRLLTAKFDFYKLRELTAEDVNRNPNGTWIAEADAEGKATGRKLTFHCRTVPHITLRSIARNTSLDPIFAKYEPILSSKLQSLNHEVTRTSARLKENLLEKLLRKHRETGAGSVTDADIRRWLLPDTARALIKPIAASKSLKGVTSRQAEKYRSSIPSGGWEEWEVPFDIDLDWPDRLKDALLAYREVWQRKMDEVNACIAANAEIEELVDQPEPVKGVVRVTGPFTIESVIAMEDGPDTPIGGGPDELEVFDGDSAVANAEAHLDKIIRLLKASGVDFPNNKNMKFSRLEPMGGASLLHAEGEWMNGDKKDRRVAVSIGPEIGNISAMQVENVIRDANRKGYDDLVFAGVGFDAAAQEAVESGSHPKLRLHMALIRPDVAMGDLLKTQPGSQLFTVFSAPRVRGPTKSADGEFTIEVEGMDVYDPVSNTLFPTDKERIAAWFLDTDYDGRTFCICQAFFPDKSKWSKLARALGDADVIEEDAFDALSGLRSLPFPRPVRYGKGEDWRVAVKVIDARGNEGLRVLNIH